MSDAVVHWPVGDGEMAIRIREFDWALTALGPSRSWNERLKAAVEMALASPLISSVTCGPQCILIYNDAAARLYGQTHPAALGAALPAIFPAGYATVKNLYDRAFAGESVSVAEQPLDTRNEGVVRDHFDAWLTPVRNERGAVIAVHMLGFEVSERVAAQTALRKSEQQYRALFESIDQGFCVIDVLFDADSKPLDYRFLEVSPSFERQTGIQNAAGRRMREIAPDQDEHWFTIYGQVALTGEAARFENFSTPLGRWYEVFAFRIGELSKRTIGLLFRDISDRKRAEAALHTSEERFRALATAGVYMVYRMSADWQVMHQLSGRAFLADTSEPVVNWADVYLLPEDRPMIAAAIAESIRTKSIFDLEHRVRTADGGVGWVHSRAVPMFGPDGEIIEWFGTGADIDARKHAEQALLLSEARLGRVLETDTVAVLFFRPDGVMTDANDVFLRMTGYTRAEVLSAQITWQMMTPPEYHSESQAQMDRFFVSGRIGPYEKEYLRKDGSRGWMQFAGRDLGDGTIAEIGIDISDRKRAEAALRESEERQAYLLTLSDMLAPLDDSAEIERVAIALLGETLGAYRAFYVSIEPDGDTGVIRSDYASGVSSAPGRYSISASAPALIADWRAGRVTVVTDVDADPRYTDAERSAYASVSARATICVPLVKRGLLVALLIINHATPRQWTEGEVKLVSETADRIWDASQRARAEYILRENEKRYRSALRVGRIGSWETDFVAGVRRWSPEGMALFGIDLPGGEGRVGSDDEWHAAIHPEDLALASHIRDNLNTQDRMHVEYRIVRPDGQTVWLHGYAEVAQRNATGRITRLLNVAADVTETKLAEAALRESEERLRQFGEASQDVLWIRGAETFQWEYLTPAFETIYGLKREIALGGDNMARWLEMIVPEDRKHAAESLGRVRDGEWVTFEYRIQRRSNGEIRWLRDTDFPISDHSGKVTRIGGIGHDVTDIKKTEAALAEAELRQRALLEGIPQLVWRAVDSGQWNWSSPQWTEFTGLSMEESRGHGWLDALHPDDREAALTHWRSAERTGAFEVEWRLLHANGYRYCWFNTRAVPVRNDAGEIIEWLGTSTDIDDLRRLQDEQRLMVAELQHRTRNLIAVVRSIAQQTMVIAGPTHDFWSRFNDRLEALSRVQGLLSRGGDDPITIGEIVRMELDALGAVEAEPRITVKGPDVQLRNSVVQTLALALHELATNARKHGALSSEKGLLNVEWRIHRAANDAPHLLLQWTEAGVARSRNGRGAASGGYGRELIEQALPYTLSADTKFELNDDGVRCTIDLPLFRAQAETVR